MRYALCLVLALGVAGCNSTKKSAPSASGGVTSEIEAPSERLLWDVVVLSVQRENFPVGTGLDPSTRTAASGWRNDLAPFRGQGFRERAIVQIEPLGEGRFEVVVRVERELNMDIARPLDLSYADWKPDADDEDAALLILQSIRSQLSLGSPDEE